MRINEIKATVQPKQYPSATRVWPFAQELGAYYGGRAEWRAPRVWSRSIGGRYRDPEHWVAFKSAKELEAAWTDLQTKGKLVHIRDIDYPSEPAAPYVKIGKLLIGRTSTSLYIQTVSIMKNYLRAFKNLEAT